MAAADEHCATLDLEYRNSILHINLARPASANALNSECIRELHLALNRAEADRSVRAVVLGAQGVHFCGGADLRELLRGGRSGVRSLLDPLRGLLCRFERSRVVIVAAVHGAARAGGLELCLACDAVVATRSATFGDAHLSNGLLPAGGATARLPRAVGWQRAKWLILSATAISAPIARDWGIVTELCEDRDLINAADQMAMALTRADGTTVAKVKGLISDGSEYSLTTCLEGEISALEEQYEAASLQTGVSNFLERKSSSVTKPDRGPARA